MTETPALCPALPSVRRRAAAGSSVGLVLAMAGVAAGATPAHAEDYTVRPGDTVSHIARRTGTTVGQISAANGLDARARILAGQRLVIPQPGQPGPAPVATIPTPPTTHTVVAGDTVSALALRYGTTTSAIIGSNGLGSNALIRIGQVLTVSGTAAPTTVPAPAPPAAPALSHIVAARETVSAIAARHGVSVADIISANGLGPDALIRIGQALSIPGAAAATAPPTVQSRTHVVRSGETVSGLATRYGTTTAAIVAANALGARAVIRIGQTLTVPGNGASSGLVGSTFAGRTYPDATVASANQNKATLLAMGVPSKAEMQSLVVTTATAMGLDPALAQAIAYQESGFNHTSVSPANAIGTMQVIPTSGAWASDLVGRDLNLLDPQDNVVAGVAILRQLVATSDDLSTAIASYYQGQAGVRKYGMYADTRRYVASVQTLMSRFA